VEGNSNFETAISFHSTIFGKMGKKMEWNEIVTPLKRLQIKNYIV
jgi:hypothetical protein